MTVHQNFINRWAFGIQGALVNTVKSSFPGLYRLWPLMHSFNFEGFDLGEGYAVIVLRDKCSGMTSGTSGALKSYPGKKSPSLPPKAADLEIWQHHFRDVFALNPDDAAFLIPAYDSEKCNVPEDYELFSAEEKFFWDQQMRYIVSVYAQRIAHSLQKITQPVNHIHVSGPNARININSTDNSTNSAV